MTITEQSYCVVFPSFFCSLLQLNLIHYETKIVLKEPAFKTCFVEEINTEKRSKYKRETDGFALRCSVGFIFILEVFDFFFQLDRT